jgi:hypothetical protein
MDCGIVITLSYGRKQDTQNTTIFVGLKDVLRKKSRMNFMDKPVMAQELCTWEKFCPIFAPIILTFLI